MYNWCSAPEFRAMKYFKLLIKIYVKENIKKDKIWIGEMYLADGRKW